MRFLIRSRFRSLKTTAPIGATVAEFQGTFQLILIARWQGRYEEALAHELQMRSIPFHRQKQVMIHYKQRVVGNHRLDLVVDDAIVLELKAVSALTDAFKQQTLSYLKAAGLRLGILINFGTPCVEYKRIAN